MNDQHEKDRPHTPDRDDDDGDRDKVPAVPPTEPEPAPLEEPPAPEKPDGYIVRWGQEHTTPQL